MSARAMGSGTIAFGMVSIPVKIYPSTKASNKIQFNNLHADCTGRLKQKYHCPTCDVDVERGEMVKGYEFAKGQFVTFNEGELKALEAQATGEIKIEEFVPLRKVDPVFFEKAYYLGYDKGGQKAYSLLCAALKQSKLAALARYYARGKEYLVLLRATKKGIILQQLHHDEDVRSFADIDIELCEVDRSQLDMAKQLISQTAKEKFNPSSYRDEIREKTLQLIEAKVEGQEIVAAPAASARSQVVDLMAALKASLNAEGAQKPAETKKTKKAKKKSA